MLIMRAFAYLATTLLFAFNAQLQASEVKIKHKNLTLNANLQIAANKHLSDGVILITHGGLAHRDMELIRHLQQLLNELGYNTLAINLSLGISDRYGMYDCNTTHRHQHQDAVDEIDAWLNWLASLGSKHNILLGHSRGAGQTALYSAQRNNKLVKAIVLMAPTTHDNGAKGYQQRYNQPLQPILQRAQLLLREGNKQAEIKQVNLLFCRDTNASAESFVSYYGQNPQLDTPALIPQLNHPALLLVAGADEVVVGLEHKLKAVPDHKQLIVQVIDGADHFFRDLNSEEAVELIDSYLLKTLKHQAHAK